MQTIDRQDVTGLILAGGRGSRMGGADKGLLPFDGVPLVKGTLDRFSPQVGTLVISCNRNFDQYAEYASTLVSDELADFQGPLAGVHACTGHVKTPLLAIVPCDTPNLPRDLVIRLAGAMGAKDDVAYVHDGHRAHYLHAVLHQRALATLPGYLKTGERSMKGWYATLCSVEVDFSEQTHAFTNINRQ